MEKEDNNNEEEDEEEEDEKELTPLTCRSVSLEEEFRMQGMQGDDGCWEERRGRGSTYAHMEGEQMGEVR